MLFTHHSEWDLAFKHVPPRVFVQSLPGSVHCLSRPSPPVNPWVVCLVADHGNTHSC